MSDTVSINPRRYRRRILGWGAFAFVVIFAAGVALVIPAIERNLERRATDRLVSVGLSDVDVSFSGQDATLRCDQPLSSPDTAREVVGGVDGVRGVDVDTSCLPGADSTTGDEGEAAGVEDRSATDQSAESPASEAEPGPAATDGEATAPSTSDAPTPADADPDGETIRQILQGDALFGTFSSLLDSVDLDAPSVSDADGSLTVLAPTDAAFDAAFERLGADEFQELLADPERLTSLLLHHVTTGAITSSDFETGPLVMLDGTDIDVDVDANGFRFRSGDSTAAVADRLTQIDIEATDGVIHAIDRLLFPATPEFASIGIEPQPIEAELDDGIIRLSGSVGDDEQRNVVVVSATLIEDSEVVDVLVVDPEVTLSDDDVALFGRAVGALNAATSGRVRFDGDDIVVEGIVDDAFAAAFLQDFGLQNGVIVLVVPADG